MKTKVLCLLVFLELSAFSQEKTTLTIHFDSDDATISAASCAKLDSLLRKLKPGTRVCRATVDGHTDNEGDLAYNQSLSRRRSESVALLLRQNGFSDDAVTIKAHAFLKPVADNDTEPGKALNRRVTVTFLAGAYAAVAAHAPAAETYTFEAAAPLNVTHRSGTRLFVPHDAFVTEDGGPVSGTVAVQYTEYRNALDFLSSGIPMSFYDAGGEFVQFNSAGMFKIEARAGDAALKLKEGVTIGVDFAKTQEVEGMGIFYFDEESSRWSAAPGAADTASPPSAQNAIRVRVSSFSRRDPCGREACRCARAAVRTGMRLAGSALPVNAKQPENAFRRDFRGPVPAFRIIKLSETKKRVRFAILPDKTAYPAPSHAVYIWEYRQNGAMPFRNEWTEHLWLRLRIEQFYQDKCFISLWRNAERLSFEAKLVTTHTIRSKKRLVRIMKNVQAPLAGEGEWMLDYPYERYMAGRRSPGRFYDSLYCFYRASAPWMETAEEKRLSFGAWLDYFNEHKPEMLIRYRKLSGDRQLVTRGCEQTERMETDGRYRDSVMNSRLRVDMEQFAAMNDLTQRLAIPRLGIWNCDQIYRLKQPVYVRGRYRTTGGDTIEPVAISVIDPQVNGILVYNDLGEPNPYNFPISPRSDNLLIAFDNKKNIYLCDPPGMKGVIESGAPIGLRKVNQEELAMEVRQWTRR